VPLSQRLAKVNRAFTNHVTMPFAARLPGFGVIVHHGRKTGRQYRTPVNAFRRPGGYVFALTYGRGDWVANVLHAGGVTLLTRGRTHELVNPVVVRDVLHPEFPAPVALILKWLDVDESLRADESPTG
jgi:deazaflavin-dependent oxidoreductase (nitroreductase family)